MASAVVAGGYYIERIKSKVGTGDTAKDASMENTWRAEPLPDGNVKMELLDLHDQPSGYREVVDEEQFTARFELLPDFQPKKERVKSERAEKMTARAERHLEKKEYLSAEFEFKNAVKLDEENVRANFGLGQTYVEMGEPEKAKTVFTKLAKIEAVLEPHNKHIFNECGMNLRKLGMYREAVEYYRRALSLVGNDENLWFNLARALAEGGNKGKGVAVLKKCLELNPEMEEAARYLKSLQRG